YWSTRLRSSGKNPRSSRREKRIEGTFIDDFKIQCETYTSHLNHKSTVKSITERHLTQTKAPKGLIIQVTLIYGDCYFAVNIDRCPKHASRIKRHADISLSIHGNQTTTSAHRQQLLKNYRFGSFVEAHALVFHQ